MVLKITRDELAMELGVYGGYPLCPLYPLLVMVIGTYSSIQLYTRTNRV